MGYKRNWFWKIALPVLAALMGWASIGFGQPEEIVLDNADSFQQKQRSAVLFQHEKHMEGLECLSCHHRYENGENVLDEAELEEGAENVTCVSCHNAESDIDLRKAFHRQCMGCHMKLRKQSHSTGPELCGECHPKK
ncbi:MAG: cytochrome c3 family protein [Desulfobacterales bacterium]|jgi:c(7)-type cytochrome triheme protein|nr:cytochrome c3 family protein [Desulfobacterales bacterium]